MGLGPVLGHLPWHEKLRRVLQKGRGIRLGESTVVSRCLHTYLMGGVAQQRIHTLIDFGQNAYQRTDRGAILHLDVWHEIGEVDHRQVAARLVDLLTNEAPPEGALPGRTLADFVDICTGTGGGRITGALGPATPSTRVAHRNHVHLAVQLSDQRLHLVYPIVSTVEQVIVAQGMELRRIESVTHVNTAGPGSTDLDHYRGLDDSLNSSSTPPPEAGAEQSLRAPRRAEGSGGGSPAAGAAAGGGAGGGPSAGATAGGGAGGGAPVPGPAQGGAGGSLPGPVSAWDQLAEEHRMQEALGLSRKLGSPEELKRVLDEFSKEQGWSALYGSGSSQAPFVVRQLEEAGLLKRELRGLRLTEEGRTLLQFLEHHLRDVKLRFRKAIRRLPGSGQKRDRHPGPTTAAPSADVRYGPIRGTAPAKEGAWLGDLAVPETVRAGLKRTYLDRVGSDEPWRPGLRLQREDIHVYLRSAQQPLHICLLIDASASMAGRRILAAKHLARHLLVSTRDKLSVISFQERDVKVHVPFTRDYGQVEEGLSRIQPMGLTPLAHGLSTSLELIKSARVRRPLLLLITDGIPTVPLWSIDPLADGLAAARQIGQGRIPFGCIGLQPSKRYLEELTRIASGTLHVVDELDEEALVTIAHRERQKLAVQARR